MATTLPLDSEALLRLRKSRVLSFAAALMFLWVVGMFALLCVLRFGDLSGLVFLEPGSVILILSVSDVIWGLAFFIAVCLVTLPIVRWGRRPLARWLVIAGGALLLLFLLEPYILLLAST